MNYIIMALFSLCLFTEMAVATSRYDIRLSLTENPYSKEGIPQVLSRLTVRNDGLVEIQYCRPLIRRGRFIKQECKYYKVALLDAYAMDKIEELIVKASEGDIRKFPPTQKCKVAPLKYDVADANNSEILLYKGHPCVGTVENVSSAAKRLLKILKHYREAQETVGQPPEKTGHSETGGK